MVVGQRHEQRVVVQPARMPAAERVHRPRASASLCAPSRSAPRRAAGAPCATGTTAAKSHPPRRRRPGRGSRSSASSQPRALQLGEVDQQHVAGEGRTAHVGRVARADAAQRQDLPQLLAGARRASRRSGRPRCRSRPSRAGPAGRSGAAARRRRDRISWRWPALRREQRQAVRGQRVARAAPCQARGVVACAVSSRACQAPPGSANGQLVRPRR